MQDFSFGIVPLRKSPQGWDVLLVFHRKGFWGFPKGHVEKGEDPKQTAERELFEETGLKVIRYLTEQEFSENYQFIFQGQRIDKTVIYFAAEVEGELVPEADEIVEGRWVPLAQASQQLTYPASQSIIRRVLAILVGNA